VYYPGTANDTANRRAQLVGDGREVHHLLLDYARALGGPSFWWDWASSESRDPDGDGHTAVRVLADVEIVVVKLNGKGATN